MIDKPGIYQIPMAEYLGDPVVTPSLTASICNTLLQRSPAHARMAHPKLYAGFEREDDSRFELGSAAHALLLEGDGSAIEFIAANDWRTNAAKEARDAARASGKTPVLNKYEGTLREMVKVAKAAIEHSEFASLFDSGKPEQTVIAKEGDVWLRCRPDWWSGDRKILANYKTAETAEPGAFGRQIGRMSYDVTSEFYLRLCAPHGAEHHIIIAQEIEAPFSCSIHALANSYRVIAEAKVERAIKLWSECMATGEWPAYSMALHYHEPPAWELAAHEAELNREW